MSGCTLTLLEELCDLAHISVHHNYLCSRMLWALPGKICVLFLATTPASSTQQDFRNTRWRKEPLPAVGDSIMQPSSPITWAGSCVLPRGGPVCVPILGYLSVSRSWLIGTFPLDFWRAPWQSQVESYPECSQRAVDLAVSSFPQGTKVPPPPSSAPSTLLPRSTWPRNIRFFSSGSHCHASVCCEWVGQRGREGMGNPQWWPQVASPHRQP